MGGTRPETNFFEGPHFLFRGNELLTWEILVPGQTLLGATPDPLLSVEIEKFSH
jgi:hypothetical protein